MCDKPGVTVLGAGARTGKPIADAFVAAGYNVAAVSRSMTESEDLAKSLINIKADFSDPSRISEVFEKTKRAFGTPPSIVIYTGMRPILCRPSH